MSLERPMVEIPSRSSWRVSYRLPQILGGLLLLVFTIFWPQPISAQNMEFGPPIIITNESFSLPSGLGLDIANQRVLIANTGRSRVSFTSITELATSTSWKDFGMLPERRMYQAAAADSFGNAYLVDPLRNEVLLFRWSEATQAYSHDPNFAEATRHKVAGLDISFPRDIAVGLDNHVYLLDSGNHRILVADGPDDDSWTVWRANSSWGNPYGLDVDQSGTVYLADTDNHRILRIPAIGSEEAIGHYGTGHGQFRYPRDVAVSADGGLFVADTFNHRVIFLNADGSHVRTLGTAPLFSSPQKIEVDDQNRVFVIDSQQNSLIAYLGPSDDAPFDVYIRDFEGDSGDEPSSDDFGLSSPDILVRHQPDVDLDEVVSVGLHSYEFQQPIYGKNNYVYLAVRNRGNQPLNGLTAKLYWANPNSTLTFPTDWKTNGFYSRYISETVKIESNSWLIPYIEPVRIPLWTRQFGHSQDDYVQNLAIDDSGIYVHQGFWDNYLLIRKFDFDGDELWNVRQNVREYRLLPGALAVNSSSIFQATVQESPDPFQPDIFQQDAFLSGLDRQGNYLWGDSIAAVGADPTEVAANDTISDIAADSSSVYFVSNSLFHFNERYSNVGVIHKYGINGNEIWSKRILPSGDVEKSPLQIALYSSEVYVVGELWDSYPIPNYSKGGFLEKYNTNGDIIWARQMNDKRPMGVFANSSGLFIVGNSFVWQDGQIVERNSFISKYDIGGSEIWTRQFDEVGTYYAVAVDPTGIYVLGTGGIIRKHDYNGNLLWSRQIEDSSLSSLAVDSSGVYVGGSTLGTLGEGTNAGESDAFLRKYTFDAEEYEPIVIGPIIWHPDSESDIAENGSYYLLARLIHIDDPSRHAAGLDEVRLNNNIALRPVQVSSDAE